MGQCCHKFHFYPGDRPEIDLSASIPFPLSIGINAPFIALFQFSFCAAARIHQILHDSKEEKAARSWVKQAT
jgi:hypothetical protein